MADSADQFSSALDAAAAVRAKKVSPLELVDAALERVDRLNPAINAVIWRNDDEARADAAQARRRDRQEPARTSRHSPACRSPSRTSRPVKGWPVTYGSHGAPVGPSDEGELVTEAFGKAGFILCGRTNTPEFGPLTVTENDRYGITRNPWNTERTPGGSSGGAAASVASGMFSDRARQRRRRLDTDTCIVLRAGRPEARSWSRAVACPRMAGHGHRGCGVQDRGRRGGVPRRISEPDPLAWANAPVPETLFSSAVGNDPGSLRIALLGTSALGLPVEREPAEALEKAGKLLEQLGHKVFTID